MLGCGTDDSSSSPANATSTWLSTSTATYTSTATSTFAPAPVPQTEVAVRPVANGASKLVNWNAWTEKTTTDKRYITLWISPSLYLSDFSKIEILETDDILGCNISYSWQSFNPSTYVDFYFAGRDKKINLLVRLLHKDGSRTACKNVFFKHETSSFTKY